MKITKIENQKNPERVNIYIDGKFAFGLSNELRYKYDLCALFLLFLAYSIKISPPFNFKLLDNN